MRNTFFVIGGAGFIGSHLVKLLIEKECKVLVYDNFSTGRISNLKDLSVKYVDTLEEGFSKSKFVIHLAGSVGNQYIDNNPRSTMINNLETTIKIFNLAYKYQTPILYTSTSEVYGNSRSPFREDQELQIGSPQESLRWGYGCAKLAGEFLGLSHEIPLVIVRPFNIIGPQQISDYGMVVPTFIKRSLRNEDLIVYGDGLQTRCFCDVGEFVDAVYKLILNKNCYGEIFNIGNSENHITIYDLAKKIRVMTGSKSNILLKPYSEYFIRNHSDINHRVPSVNKIHKFINWSSKKTIDEIIKDILVSLGE